MLTLLRVPF